jgi:hypothetical protein
MARATNLSRGVPQRREKCFGNGVKNLSGSAAIPKLLNVIAPEEGMLKAALNP